MSKRGRPGKPASVDRRALFALAAGASLMAPGGVAQADGSVDEVPLFDCRAAASNAQVADEAGVIAVVRHHADGPLCLAAYREVVNRGPLKPWHLQTNDGRRRWTLDPDQAITPQMFGAQGGAAADDAAAFSAAAAAIEANGGGRLVVPPGEYFWGVQEFAGAPGRTFAYRGRNLIEIKNCKRPVVIEFQGCRIVTRPGLRYGSFDPRTGEPFAGQLPFYQADYIAQIGNVVEVRGNESVAIVGSAEFDGAIGAQVIGGRWGDTGWQLSHTGIVAYNNKAFSCENIYAHHFGHDGFMIGWAGLKEGDPSYPHVLSNCRALYNGRQGLSWVGGNNLKVIGGEFSHTGRNGSVVSGPSAGIDIEAERSICRNGLFIGVRCVDNAGVAFLADQGDIAQVTCIDCEFVGTTMWSVWALMPQFTFINCKVVGAVPWLLGDKRPSRAAKVIGGLWSMDAKDSPTGRIYGQKMDFGASENVLFEGVSFTAAGACALPWSTAAHYSNCTFEQEGPAIYYSAGVFTGRCVFISPRAQLDASGSTIAGLVTVNGRRIPPTP